MSTRTRIIYEAGVVEDSARHLALRAGQADVFRAWPQFGFAAEAHVIAFNGLIGEANRLSNATCEARNTVRGLRKQLAKLRRDFAAARREWDGAVQRHHVGEAV